MTRGVNWSILGSVSTFKHDDLSALKYLCVGPFHHITLSKIKHDDLSTLKYLYVGPLHHTTISLIQFHHLSMITFLYLKIYASPPPHLKVPKNILQNRLKHSDFNRLGNSTSHQIQTCTRMQGNLPTISFNFQKFKQSYTRLKRFLSSSVQLSASKWKDIFIS